jgi:hypothetical protein
MHGGKKVAARAGNAASGRKSGNKKARSDKMPPRSTMAAILVTPHQSSYYELWLVILRVE